MNAPTTPALTETQKIERALDLLLSTMTDARPAPWREAEGRARTFGEFIARYADKTDAERLAESLLVDPVGVALRRAVRTLGTRLHEIGGLNLMTQVLDRVCDLDMPRCALREAIMDRAFDGIGGWAA